MAKVTKLSGGNCIVGAGREDLTPPGKHAMAGYSRAGQIGRRAPPNTPESDALWARALYLEDCETGEAALLCFVDLLSASLRLHQEVRARLPAELRDCLILSGTHTHTAPGRFFGNRFYDLLAQKSLCGFNPRWTKFAAERIANACRTAYEQRRPGRVGVHETLLWGECRNRSYEAYAANPPPSGEPAPPPDLPAEYKAIDPRVTVLTALVDQELVGSFAWFGCHPTALGPKWRTFHRDWPGVAVSTIEGGVEGDAVVAMGAGAAGDVTSMDPRDPGRTQGLALAERVGKAVGHATLAAIERARAETETAPLPLTLRSGCFEVRATPGSPRWAIGVPALGGSEDGASAFRSWRWVSDLVAEGFRGGHGEHAPKAPALGSVQAAIRGWLDVAPFHPWHRLRLGDHVVCTVPGEPTVTAARVIREAARQRLGVSSVSVLGYAGDYVGYFTTTAEYRKQHYEGASTLYGPFTLSRFVEQLLTPGRPLPKLGERLEPTTATLPQRGVEQLLKVAYEQPRCGKTLRFAFATERPPASTPPPASGARARTTGSASPPVVTLVRGGASIRGVVRPELNPDEASPLTVYVAAFDAEQVPDGAGGAPGTLQVTDVAGTRSLSLRSIEEAREERAPLETVTPLPDIAWRQRLFSLLALTMLPPLLVSLATPGLVLDLAGLEATAIRELLVRKLGLSCGLLGINLLFSKNSRDVRALVALLTGTALYWTTLGVLACVLAAPPIGSVALLAMGLLCAGLARFVRRSARRGPTPTREAWPFWRPLFWVGMLTLVVGALLILAAPWIGTLLGVTDPVAYWLIRAYGMTFLVNTIAMWGAQYTRDLAAVKGQLAGSWFLDSITSVLLIGAVGAHTLNSYGYAAALPYLAITLWFPRLYARARALQRTEILHPQGTREVQAHVREAREGRSLLRVIGSGHSVPRAIEADQPPCPPPRRPSRLPGVHLSLERLDRIVDLDRTRKLITVQAGMHLGESPNVPGSGQNNLCRHLGALGWALPDLGGIVHQTVGGFLATGSSGGSLRHSLNAAVVEIRFVDGTGRLRVAHRDRDPDTFQAAMVSMGLLGVVTEVTFACEPSYQVEGREITGSIEGAPHSPQDPVTTPVLHVPADGALPPRRVELLADGATGLAAYLREVEYCRILWWPQAGVDKMVLWEGHRTNEVPSPPIPYGADRPLAQWFAGRFLTLWGLAHGNGVLRAIGRWALPLFPHVVRFFLPNPPKRFHDRWDRNLPMDTHVDDFFLPTEFTELWFPIEHTAEVMRRLFELYRDPDVAGTYACELYATRRTESWLSPAYGQDVFRVDVFWFRGNRGDPVLDYFPKFWDALGELEFRAHWGKYLPPPGSKAGQSVGRRYPRWEDFLTLREECDPGEVFLTRYWRCHLELDVGAPAQRRGGVTTTSVPATAAAAPGAPDPTAALPTLPDAAASAVMTPDATARELEPSTPRR